MKDDQLLKFIAKVRMLEFILVPLAVLLVYLKASGIQVGSFLIICIASLAQFSVFKAFEGRLKHTEATDIFIVKLLFFGLAIGLISFLFQIQGWPGHERMMWVFIAASGVNVCLMIYYKKLPSTYLTYLEQLLYLFVLVYLTSLLFVY